jgi:hypothetical protein
MDGAAFEPAVEIEVAHVAGPHPSRQGACDGDAWNVACNHVVNAIIAEEKRDGPSSKSRAITSHGGSADDLRLELAGFGEPRPRTARGPALTSATDGASREIPTSGRMQAEAHENREQHSCRQKMESYCVQWTRGNFPFKEEAVC